MDIKGARNSKQHRQRTLQEGQLIGGLGGGAAVAGAALALARPLEQPPVALDLAALQRVLKGSRLCG